MKILFIFLVCIVSLSLTEKSNVEKFEQKPFRMGKLNLLWEKALRMLSEGKLRKLLSELKVHDADELTLKKLKASGGDKDGSKEAALRKKLIDISSRYALSRIHSVTEEQSKSADKAEFADKKLNNLWMKAEKSGLTQMELKTLKEEFQHHQDKIHEYNILISQTANTHDASLNEVVNDVHSHDEELDDDEKLKHYHENLNVIRDKHRALKTGYDDLVKKAHGINNDFFNEKVAGLWNLALRSDFNNDELDSLHAELKHYETKLQKMENLEKHMDKVSIDKYDDFSLDDREKILNSPDTEGQKILNDRLQKHKRYVDKVHSTLEQKIIARHSEL